MNSPTTRANIRSSLFVFLMAIFAVLERGGAGGYRRLVQNRIIVTRPRQSSGRFTSPFRTGFNHIDIASERGRQAMVS
jgi:hypothetical protein